MPTVYMPLPRASRCLSTSTKSPLARGGGIEWWPVQLVIFFIFIYLFFIFYLLLFYLFFIYYLFIYLFLFCYFPHGNTVVLSQLSLVTLRSMTHGWLLSDDCHYQESKVRFDLDEDFKKRAYSAVVQLQSYEPDTVKAWTLICDESRRGIRLLF